MKRLRRTYETLEAHEALIVYEAAFEVEVHKTLQVHEAPESNEFQHQPAISLPLRLQPFMSWHTHF